MGSTKVTSEQKGQIIQGAAAQALVEYRDALADGDVSDLSEIADWSSGDEEAEQRSLYEHQENRKKRRGDRRKDQEANNYEYRSLPVSFGQIVREELVPSLEVLLSKISANQRV